MDWILNQEPGFSCIQETHFTVKNRNFLRVKEWKTIFQANAPKKKAEIAILILNKIDFKLKVTK